MTVRQMDLPGGFSVYEGIDSLSYSQQCVENIISWLQRAGLTIEGRSYQPRFEEVTARLPEPGWLLKGVPCHRAQRQQAGDLKALKEQHKGQRIPGLDLTSEKSKEDLWTLFNSPRSQVLQLDINRIPADALAFYRPFHVTPCEEWGIYILVDRLLDHCSTLLEAFGGKLICFSPETLTGCVLFEVFHHEFFHHLVESAATAMEILSVGLGEPKPVYRQYWECCYRQALGTHPDDPLEEALGNAYAYNSFGFLARVKPSYNVLLSRVYQEILEKCWPLESEGYRSAGLYKGSRYVSGAAQLLAMILGGPHVVPAALLLLAERVMPTGHAALAQKSDIPTYLLGNDHSLRLFHELVPAPNETYTSLFWHFDTDPIDEYLRKRREAEKRAKAEARAREAARTA